MRTRGVILGVLLAVALVTSALPVSADPIQITGGGIGLLRMSDAVWAINGPGFQASGGMGVDPGYYPPKACYQTPCNGGFNLSIHDSITRWSNNIELWGQVYFDGAPYFSGVQSLTYNISAGDPYSDPGIGTVHRPFTFTGTLVAWDGTDARTLSLVGQGTANAYYGPLTPMSTGWISSGYTFDGASPTPEPASLLLLGTGALGLCARRRRAHGESANEHSLI